MAGGYTLKMPSEDRRYHTLAQFKDDLAMAMGGFVAEKMFFGDDMVSTGPSSDLRSATNLARSMVTQYGMSKVLGPRTFGEHDEMVFLGKEIHEERDYSDKTAEEIDKEIKFLVEEAEGRARETILKYKDQLEKMVAVLLEKEIIEEKEIKEIIGVL
jgi:cell division protease FtsH